MTDANPTPTDSDAPQRTYRLQLCRIEWLIVTLAAVWIFAGAGKLLDLHTFAGIVSLHGVLPAAVHPFLPAIPVIEIALGFTLLVCVGHGRRVAPLRASLIAGCLLLLAFAVYDMLVPSAVLEEVGCGCFGQSTSRLAAGIPISSRLVSPRLRPALGLPFVRT